MCAVYAFARRIDDIGDGDLPAERKLADAARSTAHRARDGDADDPAIVALADARARFRCPPAALDDLIDGVELDVRGTTLRDLRRAARLLPARRRLGRAAVRGHLRRHRPGRGRCRWPTTSASRCS